MPRAEAISTINEVLYGSPGAAHDTEKGRELIRDLVEEMGLSALTDAAVIRLAQMHEQADQLQALLASFRLSSDVGSSSDAAAAVARPDASGRSVDTAYHGYGHEAGGAAA